MSDVAALYTAGFIRSALPPGSRRLLEVGCGDGRVAALLQADGYEVIAVDADAAAVDAARARGVDARVARWPAFGCGAVDAVLFTRSLHHIHPLDASVRAAFDALDGPGVVIVEDFAYDAPTEATLRWFRSIAALLVATGSKVPPPLVAGLIEQQGDLRNRWLAEHDHDLHTEAVILAAIAGHAARLTKARAACYFRYLAPMLEGDEAGLAALLRHEEELVELDMIAPLGRRFVASVGAARRGSQG